MQTGTGMQSRIGGASDNQVQQGWLGGRETRFSGFQCAPPLNHFYRTEAAGYFLWARYLMAKTNGHWTITQGPF